MRFKNPWLVCKLLAKSHILKDYSDRIYLSRKLTVDETKWSRVFSLNVINLSKPVSQRID